MCLYGLCIILNKDIVCLSQQALVCVFLLPFSPLKKQFLNMSVPNSGVIFVCAEVDEWSRFFLIYRCRCYRFAYTEAPGDKEHFTVRPCPQAETKPDGL